MMLVRNVVEIKSGMRPARESGVGPANITLYISKSLLCTTAVKLLARVIKWTRDRDLILDRTRLKIKKDLLLTEKQM